ncbi:hypothetical protein F3Y22_tig00111847pilonHSYRG00139 [Hibiscus syriacus]|uniref:Uncharacterized protein n=1 Tax=Hibiscus syriacus TaxID=106335 RepID=A0A6A2YFJ1_HIBSY|nr:hypothetical protein F3Y22_tig00111847pilonHSYRG00139 [Hibiscus syriacus]
MWIEGLYVALYLRLEKDVWVRTGCLTGLGSEFDKIVTQIQKPQPQYLTGRFNMSYSQRHLSGLCPINALEMSSFLRVNVQKDCFFLLVPHYLGNEICDAVGLPRGNMGRALRGHRAYMGHRKNIWPNKRIMFPLFEDSSIADEELSRITRSMHSKSIKLELRKKERDKDVIASPVPECMCRHGSTIF